MPDESRPIEVVILIGLQGSGKSSFRRQRFSQSHVCVSKDDFRNNSRPSRRQRQLVDQALAEQRSVVIDNTNPTVTERSEIIELARQRGARIVGYYFESRVEDCLRRNETRCGKDRVPAVAIFSTIKRLERPTLSEGFDELSHVCLRDDGTFELTRWQGEINDECG